MAIVTKGRFWNRTKYNTKTGLRKGQERHSTDGTITDWMGNTRRETNNSSMGRNGWD